MNNCINKIWWKYSICSYNTNLTDLQNFGHASLLPLIFQIWWWRDHEKEKSLSVDPIDIDIVLHFCQWPSALIGRINETYVRDSHIQLKLHEASQHLNKELSIDLSNILHKQYSLFTPADSPVSKLRFQTLRCRSFFLGASPSITWRRSVLQSYPQHTNKVLFQSVLGSVVAK